MEECIQLQISLNLLSFSWLNIMSFQVKLLQLTHFLCNLMTVSRTWKAELWYQREMTCEFHILLRLMPAMATLHTSMMTCFPLGLNRDSPKSNMQLKSQVPIIITLTA
jgi:hypothetical protein